MKSRLSGKEIQNARSTIGYWRHDRTQEDMFASELAFSLIYDNIKRQQIPAALATMGLSELPNTLVLIQVDDYLSKNRSLNITREFTLKAGVLNQIRACLLNIPEEGFAANLIGLDTLICFLSLPDSLSPDDREEYLSDVISTFCEAVYQNTHNTITACVGSPCRDLSDYPKSYLEAQAALQSSFYSGKGLNIAPLHPDEPASDGLPAEEADPYPLICACLSSRDSRRFSESLDSLQKQYMLQQLTPQQIRTHVTALMHSMESYLISCEIIGKRKLASVTHAYTDQVIVSGYIDDIMRILEAYFSELCGLIGHRRNRFPKQVFQEPVDEYIRNHFGEQISLEQIASILGYSPFYVTRLFRKYYGSTLITYLTRYRIQESQKMLRDPSMSIGEIAARCGFVSLSYFGSCFRKETGLSPSAFRRRELPESPESNR